MLHVSMSTLIGLEWNICDNEYSLFYVKQSTRDYIPEWWHFKGTLMIKSVLFILSAIEIKKTELYVCFPHKTATQREAWI